MPSPYMMSNSHSRNGGATLFFATLALGVARYAIAVFDRADATDIQPQRRVKLEGAAAVSRLGIAEHNAVFSRIWLMKIKQVFDCATIAVSLRSACDIKRACKPGSESPISPSSSALGTRAATESTTITWTPLERTRASG